MGVLECDWHDNRIILVSDGWRSSTTGEPLRIELLILQGSVKARFKFNAETVIRYITIFRTSTLYTVLGWGFGILFGLDRGYNSQVTEQQRPPNIYDVWSVNLGLSGLVNWIGGFSGIDYWITVPRAHEYTHRLYLSLDKRRDL